jgi:hypothetical protein
VAQLKQWTISLCDYMLMFTPILFSYVYSPVNWTIFMNYCMKAKQIYLLKITIQLWCICGSFRKF